MDATIIIYNNIIIKEKLSKNNKFGVLPRSQFIMIVCASR
jgi:hypothetical protein